MINKYHHWFYLIVLLLFYIVPVSSQNKPFDPKLQKIIAINDENKKLIDDDFSNISSQQLFYYFLLVSEELQHIQLYQPMFENLVSKMDQTVLENFQSTKAINLSENQQQKLAENLLIYLHQFIFKKYMANSNSVSELFDRGWYNCVSSSILYGIFLKRYGLALAGI
ncbi:MAG: hypothetical protein MJB14_08710, partial [Spirochaetes bacterium]|nr:hypothetical protein [Spirochaetota bacterium]